MKIKKLANENKKLANKNKELANENVTMFFCTSGTFLFICFFLGFN
jgi:hypothetical protein